MTIARDEIDDLAVPEADPIREAIGQLLVAIINATAEGSPERAKAMNEALEVHERIKIAMRVRPRLQ
jgi:hypothetical protein